MRNPFENKNNQIAAGQVEENAFFNPNNSPDSQMAKLDTLDGIIDKLEDAIKDLNKNIALPDGLLIIENDKLNDLLDSAKIERDTLISEGNERIGIRNLDNLNSVVNSAGKNSNKSAIFMIAKLNKEIDMRRDYIESQEDSLDDETIRGIEKDIEEKEAKIDSLVMSN